MKEPQDIFYEALEKDPTELDAFLDEACGDNATLRAEILELLKYHETTSKFLASPLAGANIPADPLNSVNDSTQISERPSPSVEDSNTTYQGRPSAWNDTRPLRKAKLPLPNLPGYRLLHEIARGGMGVVYLAHQIHADRTVALKMILSSELVDDETRERFRTEAHAIARLQHPGIVQIYDVGENEGHPYFSMEFCESGSLTEYLDGTPLGANDSANVMRDLADAIQTAHDANVIHRDLKPANVLLALRPGEIDSRPEGKRPPLSSLVAKIADFGLAKKLDDATLTSTGMVMGTPSYMSPEQAAGSKTIGKATDIYSLGVILYECLTGRPPFRAANSVETVFQVIHEEPASPRQLQPSIPKDLETICLKCLQKDPQRRYASARELADELSRFLEGKSIHARPVSGPEKAWRWSRRNPLVAGLFVALVLVLILGTAIATTFAIQSSINEGIAKENFLRAEKEKTKAKANAEQAKNNAQAAKTNEDVAKANAEVAKANEDVAKANAEVAKANEKKALAKEKEAQKLAKQLAEKNKELDQQIERLNRLLFDAQLQKVGLVYRSSPDEAYGLLHDYKVCPIALRGPAWHFYHNLCRPARTELRWPKTGLFPPRINVLAFSSDGTILAAAGGRSARLRGVHGEIKFWKFPGPKDLGVLKAHDRLVTSMALNKDGTKVVSASQDGTVKVWVVPTWKLLASFPGFRRGRASVQFGPDDNTVISVGVLPSRQRQLIFEVRIGDVRQKKVVRTFQLKQTSTYAFPRFSPNGKLLACVEVKQNAKAKKADWTITVYDVSTGKVKTTLKTEDQHPRYMTFGPEGQRLAAIYHKKNVYVWDIPNSKEIHKFQVPDVGPITFSPDAKHLFVARPGAVDAWDLTKEKVVTSAQSSFTTIATITANATTGTIAFGRAFKNSVQLWKPFAGGEMAVLPKLPPGQLSVYSRDRKLLAMAKDKVVQLVDATTRKVIATLGEHPTPVKHLVLSRDGKTLVSVSTAVQTKQIRGVGKVSLAGENTIKFWDVTKKKVKTVLKLPERRWLMALSPDGQTFAMSLTAPPRFSGPPVSARMSIRLWDVSSGKVIPNLEGKDARMIKALAFSPDSKFLLSGSQGTVKIWNAKTGKLVKAFIGHTGPVHAIAMSPDGTRVASAAGDGTFRLWDVKNGMEIARLKAHTKKVNDVVFGPNSEDLASSSTDKTIRLWDARNGQPQAVLRGHPTGVNRVEFSIDGTILASRGSDDKVRLWNLRRSKTLAVFDNAFGRIRSIAFSKDEKFLRVRSEFFFEGGGDTGEKRTFYYDLTTGQALPKAPDISFLSDSRESPDGKLRIEVDDNADRIRVVQISR